MQPTPDFARLPQSIRTPSFPYGHCQGIAVDTERGCVYYSFTTALVKTDLSGNFLGSAVGLLGHLGCIVRNGEDGLIYGSLEYKNDAIGKGILKRAAVSGTVENGFYIAVFDGDKIVRAEMDAEGDGIMTAAFLKPVTDDYLGTAENGEMHIFGCSGIDGTAIGPMPGDAAQNPKQWLFVAYGIYSDVNRCDNDHQVLLRFDPEDIKAHAKPLSQENMHRLGEDMAYARYFVYTGNTTYGVQNLEYDPARNVYLMAVYQGKKPQFPNYPMYLIDAGKAPVHTVLCGLGTQKGDLLSLAPGNVYDDTAKIPGVDYPYGATGIAALGADDAGVPYYYVSYDEHEENGWYTVVRLCRGDDEHFIVPAER
ncbi:MAG: hypothetical protein J6I50_09890 [Clostridia bacterium]|nr:hypothetical protein [Clostridia bacterium]